MREWEIAVNLDAPTQPDDRFGVFTAPQLGDTGKHHPSVSENITGGQTERVPYMCLGLIGTAKEMFGDADEGMRSSQISIQCERLFAFGNTLGRSRRVDMHGAQIKVGPGVLRSQGQRLDRGRLCRSKRHRPVFGKKVNADIKVNDRRAKQCSDTIGIDCQSTFKKATRLCQVFVS